MYALVSGLCLQCMFWYTFINCRIVLVIVRLQKFDKWQKNCAQDFVLSFLEIIKIKHVNSAPRVYGSILLIVPNWIEDGFR